MAFPNKQKGCQCKFHDPVHVGHYTKVGNGKTVLQANSRYLPTGAISDLAKSDVAIKFLDASAYLPQVQAQYGPFYEATTLSKETYTGMAADVPGIGIANVLVVKAAMLDDEVIQLLTTIFDNLDEVQAINSAAGALTLKSAPLSSAIPFHPAAIKFYQDKGVSPK